MKKTFQCITEFELGPEASALMTCERMEEMVREVVLAAACCALLEKEICPGRENSSAWESINLHASLPPASMKTIQRRAQKGDRMAVLVDDVENILRIVAVQGYLRCAEPSQGAADYTRSWSSWLGQHFPDMPGALVFGHDWNPIFIFTNGRAPPDTMAE